jgi:ligand-binding sensor domain-containing protein/signal transduction histidine kinase
MRIPAPIRVATLASALLITLPTVGTPQSLPFESYASDDGLAQSIVFSLTQDRDGYLWLGTPNGLSRFDGLEFTTFTDDDGLPSNVVRTVLEDGNGTLWAGTDAGLARFHDGVWEMPTAAAELRGESVRALVSDDNGLWIGTHGGGLAHLTPNGLRRYTTADGLADDRVRSLQIDTTSGPPGRLVVGTYGGGVSIWEGGHFTSYAQDEGLANDVVRALIVDGEGRLLAGTNAGVYEWTPDGFRSFARAAALADATVTSLTEDSNGRLWLGTRDRGACHLGSDELICYRSDQGLADDSITKVYEDRESNLWFATFGGGISRLSNESFRNYSGLNGLPPGAVQAFAEVEGEIWIATHGGGLARVGREGRLQQIYTRRDGLPHDKVLALAADPSSGLWVGTLEGAVHLDKGQRTLYATEGRPPQKIVSDIAIGRDGTVWLATVAGLIEQKRDGSTRTYTASDGLVDERVNVLALAAEGGLWVGTAGGLCRLVPAGSITCRGEDDGLAGNYIHALVERADGSLWITSDGGLNHFDGTHFRTYTSADGLLSDKTTALVEDDAGRLWVGTARGVNIFDGERFTAFTVEDGLVSGEITSGAAMRDSSGRLWFGTVRGATVFEPSAAAMPPSPPLNHLTGLAVHDQPIGIVADLVLAHSRNHLRFEFVGVSLAYPEDLFYEYRLSPLDPSWHKTSNRAVDYAALPPGKYVFEVRARVADTTSLVPARFVFEIARPFYSTGWFRAAAVFLALALAFALHRLRLRNIRRQKKELESLVDERTAELLRERREVSKKNKQLEITHSIVREINHELQFDRLLESILEGVSFFGAASCALALVRQQGSDLFTAKAGYCWPTPVADLPTLSRPQVEAALFAPARRIADGIHTVAVAKKDGPLGQLPTSYLIFTVKLEGSPAGYLVFGNARESEPTGDDLDALIDLMTHVTSAFVKGRLMEQLRDLNAKKNEFLGIAAHDLRSPLGGVASYTDLLLKLLDEERVEKDLWQRFLGNIRVTADEMLTLVNDLLDVAAIETGRVELRLVRHRMSELLEDRETLHRQQAEAKNIDLVIDQNEADVEILIDRVRVGEVLDNLMTNAVKYTAPGGRVRIYCETQNGDLVTHVEDSGQGLAPEELDRVFTGTKLSARPTAGESSTGLGLVIVKKLVELHGGRCWVRSEKDKGSTFSFSLPTGGVATPED